MMKLENIEEQNNERYLCYRPVEEFRIFRTEVDKLARVIFLPWQVQSWNIDFV